MWNGVSVSLATFRRKYCFHLRGRKVSQASSRQEVCRLFPSGYLLAYSSTLKMEAESIFDMSVNLGTTQRDIREDSVIPIIICLLGTEILWNLCGELKTVCWGCRWRYASSKCWNCRMCSVRCVGQSLLVHESCQERKCAGEDNDDIFVDKSESCGKPSIPMMMMMMILAGAGCREWRSGR
jgi:hypothetical protein